MQTNPSVSRLSTAQVLRTLTKWQINKKKVADRGKVWDVSKYHAIIKSRQKIGLKVKIKA